jgi:cytochrome c oxidase assembly protein subunit 15
MFTERPLELLTRAVTLLVVGLLIFGFTVPRLFSVVECGAQFPVCNGSLLPLTDTPELFIGWFARLFSVALAALGVLLLGLIIFGYVRQLMNLQEMVALAALLLLLQGLGSLAIVVLGFNLIWIAVHLLAAVLIGLALILAGVWSTYITDERQFRPFFTAFGYLVTIIAFAVSIAANFLVLTPTT